MSERKAVIVLTDAPGGVRVDAELDSEFDMSSPAHRCGAVLIAYLNELLTPKPVKADEDFEAVPV